MRAANPAETPRRWRRTIWAIVAFLCGFLALIVLVTHYFLLPAMDAARDADVAGRRQLSAVSTLLLAVLLLTMMIGLLMTFRVRRFFFPRASAAKTKTEVVDAWAESARRMPMPGSEDDPT